MNFENKTRTCIPQITITPVIVAIKIGLFDNNKACGLDGMHPRQLRELVDHVSAPIARILNQSLQDGKLPLDWKNAVVSPIFKKGDKHVAANYRPISLTSIVCKLMESFVKEAIISLEQTIRLHQWKINHVPASQFRR